MDELAIFKEEHIGELAEVRRLLDTPVNYPLMHPETWQLAIDAILQDRQPLTGLLRICASW